MTILLSGTPLAAIWKTEDFGQVLEEAVRSPEQVVYSEVPSAFRRNNENAAKYGKRCSSYSRL